MRTLLSRLLSLFRPRAGDEALDEEIRAHLELLAADYERRGMTPHEARLAARRAFGGTEQIKEQYRDQWGFRSLEDLRRDVAYALRTFGRNPTFSAVATATLAIGIAATTATFSVVKAVLLEPLPYQDPDRLVQIVENIPAAESLSGAAMRLSAMNQDEFEWWRSRTKTLSHMALLVPESRTMLADEGAVRLPAARVSPALFPMLGVQPVLGRWLRPDEERSDANVAVLSIATWRQYFGSDPNVIDRVIVLDGRSYAVVGIMPPQFDVPAQDTAVWIPYAVEPPRPGMVTITRVMSRLRDGVSIEAAAAEADLLGRQLRGLSADGAEPRFEIVRTKDQMVASVRPALRVLVVAVAVVLLIVCANVANLLLVRGATRQRELSIRHAIGAGRARIVRQLLTECAVLSLAGGIAGSILAVAAVQLLKVLTVVDIPAVFSRAERTSGGILPRVDRIDVDGGVLAFAFGLSLLTGVVFGVVPAMRASRVNRGAGIPTGLSNAPGASGRSHNRVGPLLAIVQVIMATTLLVGAGLLLGSFVRLSSVEAGFDPEGVLHFQLVLPQPPPPEEKLRIAGDVTARLQALPRVEAAGFTNSPPLENLSLYASFLPPGMTDREFLQIPRRERPQARSVSTGYLRAMGVRLLEGRWLDERDTPGRQRVVLVNRAYARRYLGGQSPIGNLLKQGTQQVEVVGLVDDVRLRTLDGVTEPAVFGEPNQLLRSGALPGPASVDSFIVGPSGAMSFAVRVRGDPLSIGPDLRAIVRQVDPRAAIEGMTPMREIVAGTLARPRFYTATLNVFGVIAGILAAIGIYGVLAYSVTQRTQEIGIRLAIGAQPGDVLALVLRQGGTIAIAGIAVGMAGAVGLTRYLEGMLFGLTPLDPATYAIVAVVFAAAAMLAAYVPARRATKIDPLMALRSD